MLLYLYVVAVCFSFAGLSAGSNPWNGPPSDRKDRSVTEGSGAGNGLAWDGINDDEDDPRGRSVVEGSGASPAIGQGFGDDEEDDTRRVEGSGNGKPSETYPKQNRNDEDDWQTPWEPANKFDDLPGGSKPDTKRKGSPPIKADDEDDFLLTNTNAKPAPAPGNDVSNNNIEGTKKTVGEDVHIVGHGAASDRPASFFAQPGILAAVIGGVVVGLLCTVLLLMYIVYRMRKMDEGSYPLEEPRKTPSNKQSQEFFA